MKKEYLSKYMLFLALVVAVVSCSKDNWVSPEEGVKNAEKVLGVTIDPLQDWKMTTQVTGDITVNLGLDQKYTIVVYDENPLYNEDAVYYFKKTVNAGEPVKAVFSAPSTKTRFYVATFDSKLRRMVSIVDTENNHFSLIVGNSSVSRSVDCEDPDLYPEVVKTMEDYLNPDLDAVKDLIRLNNQLAWSADNYTIGAVLSVDEMKEYTAITDDIIVNETSNGNRTLSDKSWYYNPADYPGHGDGKHYRVAAGTEITEVFHINGTQYSINDAVIYIEGTVHLNGNTLNGPTIVVADGGEVIIEGNTSLSNCGRFVVMPGGKITGSDGVEFNVTNGMPCYNAGIIDFDGMLNVNGSDFYSNNTVNVDVLRNTSGGRFTNFGTVTARTNMLQGDTYNCEVINGCTMYYTEDAGIGNLTMLNNSLLSVGGKLITTGSFNLYNSSLILVQDLQMQMTQFNAPRDEDDFAVLKIVGDMYVGQGPDFGTAGNLYVDWPRSEEGIFVNGAWNTIDNQWSALGIIKGNVYQLISEPTSPIVIPAGGCSGVGYHDTGSSSAIDDDIPGSPAVWTFAFEDTFNGDYDMNDVVLQVKENEDDDSKIDVTLCCTGASFNLYVFLRTDDGRDLRMFNGREVHAVLGQPSGKFINTGEGDSDKFISNIDPVKFTFDKPSSNFDIATADFWIQSPQGDIHVGTTYGAGSAPYGLVIPKAWRWPKEWNTITGNSVTDSPYPDFAGFAADRTVNTTWYDNVVEDLVY